MRALSIVSLALVVLLGSCKKDDDPKFTSPDGDWTYTTPDGKIGVSFTIKQDGSTLKFSNEAMTVDGTDCVAALQAFNVTTTKVGSIRINANDQKVTYDYFILFTDAEVSADFTQIKVPGAMYTWPFDKTNQLTDIVIARK